MSQKSNQLFAQQAEMRKITQTNLVIGADSLRFDLSGMIDLSSLKSQPSQLSKDAFICSNSNKTFSSFDELLAHQSNHIKVVRESPKTKYFKNILEA